MKDIGIIGSGKLGSSLAELAIRSNEFASVDIWNRSVKTRKGLVESLSLLSYALRSETQISEFNWKDYQKYNLIVLSLKENYDPRWLLDNYEQPDWIPNDLRYVGLVRDLSLIHQVCRKIKSYSGKVLVLTNPMDVVTSMVDSWLPDASVYGGGLSLDAMRLTRTIKEEIGKDVDYEQISLVGEHGVDYFLHPLGLNKLIFSDESENIQKKVIKKTNSLAYEIVNNLGYTLHDCAEIFSRDLRWLLGINRKKGSIRSFSVRFDNICLGRPLDDQLNMIELHPSEVDRLNSMSRHIKPIVQKLKELYIS